MLVLTRRPNEEVVIEHGRIVVRVLEIGGGQVKLGVTAPPEVAVHRREIQDRVDREKAEPREPILHAQILDKEIDPEVRAREAIDRINARRLR